MRSLTCMMSSITRPVWPYPQIALSGHGGIRYLPHRRRSIIGGRSGKHCAAEVSEPVIILPKRQAELIERPCQAPGGGPVIADVIENLVAANRILVAEGVLDAYVHVSARHPVAPAPYFLSRP